MTETLYDLRDDQDVARYLAREGLAHDDPSFARFRQQRVSQGFWRFVVQHGDEAETPISERRFMRNRWSSV
jgi:hypothetical protein